LAVAAGGRETCGLENCQNGIVGHRIAAEAAYAPPLTYSF
jgi:hypothetical protein